MPSSTLAIRVHKLFSVNADFSGRLASKSRVCECRYSPLFHPNLDPFFAVRVTGFCSGHFGMKLLRHWPSEWRIWLKAYFVISNLTESIPLGYSKWWCPATDSGFGNRDQSQTVHCEAESKQRTRERRYSQATEPLPFDFCAFRVLDQIERIPCGAGMDAFLFRSPEQSLRIQRHGCDTEARHRAGAPEERIGDWNVLTVSVCL